MRGTAGAGRGQALGLGQPGLHSRPEGEPRDCAANWWCKPVS